jgi:periplasmic divalent cation tolerance protein
MSSPIVFFYLPVPDPATAETLVRTLLTERLIACANILPTMQSVYWWQGEIETTTECLVIGKTCSDLSEALRQRLEALHPYETPCIAEFSVQNMNTPYQDWLLGNLQIPESD